MKIKSSSMGFPNFDLNNVSKKEKVTGVWLVAISYLIACLLISDFFTNSIVILLGIIALLFIADNYDAANNKSLYVVSIIAGFFIGALFALSGKNSVAFLDASIIAIITGVSTLLYCFYEAHMELIDEKEAKRKAQEENADE